MNWGTRRKWYKRFAPVELIVGGMIAILLVLILWSAWYEATFDYTLCSETDKYRAGHSPAYTTYMKVGDVQVPTFHPARDWTERLYRCPEGDRKGTQFDKWRRENQP